MKTTYNGKIVPADTVVQAPALYVDPDTGKGYPIAAVNAQTGTAYTPVLADVGKTVTLTNAEAITLTFVQDSAETNAIPVGAVITFEQLGAGLVTAAAGSGATVNQNAGKTKAFLGQYSRVVARKTAANTWLIAGDLAAAG